MLKVGSAALVLEMIEAGVPLRDFTFENPIRAIREISNDLTGRKEVKLANGSTVTALDAQHDYYQRAVDYVAKRGNDPITDRVLELWGRVLIAVENYESVADRHRDRLGDQEEADRPLRRAATAWS